MAVRTLPRPRTFEDVCARLELLATNVDMLTEAVQQQGVSVATLIEAFGKSLAPPPPMRDPEVTLSGLESEFAEYRRTIRERVKDPTRFDSERARAEISDEAQHIENVAAGWAAQHLTPAAVTTMQGLEAFGIGMLVAGAAAIANLMQPAPVKGQS